MKPGRKLVLEAMLVPLMIGVAFWELFYFRPRVPSQNDGYHHLRTDNGGRFLLHLTCHSRFRIQEAF